MAKKDIPSTSLIVSTYNWPEALRLCLESIRTQSLLPNEVIIADDGSKEETRQLIEGFQKNFPVPLIHVWQPDEGFQLAGIRNRAIAASKMEYIIQVDGDLLLHKQFVKDHACFSRQGYFVSGSRVIMDAVLSKQLLDSGKSSVSVFSKGIKNTGNGMHIPILTTLFAGYRRDKLYNLRGCNMAFWKSDLLAVNGYNEAFQGWGKEDSELVARLWNHGIQKRAIKFGGIVFHLYHRENSREQLDANESLLAKTISEKIVYCEKGVSQFIQ